MEGLGGVQRAAPVAAGHAVAAQPDLADPPLGELPAADRIDDADVEVLGADPAAGDEGAPARPGGGRDQRVPFEGGVVDGQPPVCGAGGAAGDDEGGLGQAVARVEALGAQPGRSEAVGERVHGGGTDRLGPAQGQAPAGQVEGGDLLVGDAAGAQVVAEVGAAADGQPVVADGLQPAHGAPDEGGRRHVHGEGAEEERVQQVRDEAHVVVVRQPAREPVGLGGAQHVPERLLVGHQVAVADHHSARPGGGAGGVLEERQVVRPRPRALPGGGVGGRVLDVGGQAHGLAAPGHRQPQRGVGGVGGVGQHEAGAGVLEDAGDALEAFAAVAGQRGRHGDGARVQAAHERLEEVGARRVQQQDGLALGPVLAQPHRQRAGLAVEFGVRHVLGAAGVVQEDLGVGAAPALGAVAHQIRERAECSGQLGPPRDIFRNATAWFSDGLKQGLRTAAAPAKG